MYFKGVNPFKAFIKSPKFAWSYFVTSGIRTAHAKFFHKKLLSKHYAGKKVLPRAISNDLLREAIIEGKPFFMGRHGSNEILISTEAILYNKKIISNIDIEKYKVSCLKCGFNPRNVDDILKFSDLITDSCKQLDIYGTFRMIAEDFYIKTFMPQKTKITYLNMLDFWRYDVPFTYGLKGKKVLVIHPLAETIEDQYRKREYLFENKYVLPEFSLKTLKAVQTIANSKDDRFENWFEALEYMYNEAMKIDFDVAILGCGAYGMPLSAKLKKAGKVVIYMGGVTQMLFGIKGARWDKDPEASKLYNNYWVKPLVQDIPQNADQVEERCYW